MVAALPIGRRSALGWLGYLSAALCLVVLLAACVEFSKPTPVLETAQVLKVSLQSLAAPRAITAPQETPKSASKPQVKPLHNVVTHQEAQKKVAQPVAQKAPELAAKTPPKKPTPKKVEPEPKPEITQREQAPLKAPTLKASPSKTSLTEDRGSSEATAILNPRTRKQVAPVYPRRSLAMGEEGVVTLHAEVLPNGKPRALKVHESSGHRRLDMAALAAVKKWEFETDRNSIQWVRVPVRFIIN